MPLEAGTRVGRYTITRLIAQGGMAEVYRAEQELTTGVKRPAAVKIIRAEYSESEDFRQMFLDEARTACTLSHPNIVHIYEVGESDDGLLYMAMELVPGETLATINRTLREHEERFSDEALFAIGINTASALEAAHALKVEAGQVNLVHRDVSPHNLLLSATGNLKLIDFGIAKAATNRNLTMPGVTKGKAGYFSPEQAMGKKLDGRSDLFSLGVTLYKLASGVTPFDDHSNYGERHAALVRGQWRPLEETFPGLPAGYYAVVDRALKLKPDDRYATAREMREDLEGAAYESGVRVTQSSLIGYVGDDGEVTAAGGARSSVFPITAPPTQSNPSLRTRSGPAPAHVSGATKRVTGLNAAAVSASRPSLPPSASRPTLAGLSGAAANAAPPLKEAHTEKVAAQKRNRSRTLYLAIAFGAAVIIGVFGIMLVFGRGEPEVVVTPKKADPAPRVVEPVKPPEVLVVEPVKVAVAPVIDAGEEDVAVVKPPKPPKNPKVLAVRPPKEATPPVTPPPAKPPDEVAVTIPAGEGKLRIGATNSALVAGVVVGRDDWGAPPVNRPVSSGRYTVVLKLSDGRKSPAWTGAVLPDRTTTLMYDTDADRWSVK